MGNINAAKTAADAVWNGLGTVIEYLTATNDPSLQAALALQQQFNAINGTIQNAWQNSGGPTPQGMGN